MPSVIRSELAATRAGRAISRPVLVLFVVMICQLMLTVTIASVNLSLPAIRTELTLTVTSLSWVSNTYLLAFGGLLLVAGRAGDLLGRRRLFVAGIALFTVCSIVSATAGSVGLLIVGLFGQGVGAAMAEPASLALIAGSYPEGPGRNRALGIFSTAAGLGLSLGLVVGGALSSVSWRLAFLLAVPLGLAILVLVPFGVPETPRTRGRFDWAGALTFTVGVTALVYGLAHVGSAGWADPLSFGPLAGGVLLLASTAVTERRAEHPIVPPALLAEPARVGAYVSLLLVGTLGATLLFCMFQFMQDSLGLSPVGCGVAFVPFAVVLFGSALAAPRLLTRLGVRAVVVGGTVLLIAGAAWLTRLEPTSSYVGGVLGPLVLLAAGEALAVTTLTMAILRRVPSSSTGSASGLQQAMLRLGGSIGLAATATVFAGVAGSDPLPDVAVDGYAAAFGVTAAFFVVALLIAVACLGRPAPKPVPDGLDHP